MGVAPVNDEVKCCALPGCDVAIVDVPGRPARRYCPAAHRPAPAASAAAWTPPRQAPTRSPRPRRAPAAPARPRTRKAAEFIGGRRRAAAVLGAVGILAGGYAVSTAVPIGSAVQPALAGRAP